MPCATRWRVTARPRRMLPIPLTASSRRRVQCAAVRRLPLRRRPRRRRR
ncbi:hypothetical protein [Lysobacter gummosus]